MTTRHITSRTRTRTAPQEDTGTSAAAEMLLTEYAQLSTDLAAMSFKKAQVEAQLEQVMKGKLKSISISGYVAGFVTKEGRATSSIDAKKFRDLVDDDADFIASIDVVKARAAQVLSAKQLASCTNTTAGKTSTSFEVKAVKVK